MIKTWIQDNNNMVLLLIIMLINNLEIFFFKCLSYKNIGNIMLTTPVILSKQYY